MEYLCGGIPALSVNWNTTVGRTGSFLGGTGELLPDLYPLDPAHHYLVVF